MLSILKMDSSVIKIGTYEGVPEDGTTEPNLVRAPTLCLCSVSGVLVS